MCALMETSQQQQQQARAEMLTRNNTGSADHVRCTGTEDGVRSKSGLDTERIPVLSRPWVLAGGLTPANVGAAIEQVAPQAVDVSGGVENTSGEKDPRRMRQFIDAVRKADKRKHEDAAV